MIGGRTPGVGTPGRSPFGFGTPGRRDPDMYNSPFRSPLAGLNFGAFSPLQGGGFSPTKSPGGLGSYSPTSPGYSPTSPGLCLCYTNVICPVRRPCHTLIVQASSPPISSAPSVAAVFLLLECSWACRALGIHAPSLTFSLFPDYKIDMSSISVGCNGKKESVPIWTLRLTCMPL